ncbi:LysR family transcriptional repressor of citA [Bacillus fengqiuensis]|nr:LysR family transcriptional repressor of citA [Bacillus fengqiuensis]
MEMKWLKTFIAAAEYENFRMASEELYLTQPAVTKHIKRLEQHLNIPLFERTGKNIVLTPAGSKFLLYAKGIVQKYEEGMEEFEGWKQGYHRKLTVAAAPQIAASMLPPFLRRFIEEYPDIEVIINVVRSFEIGEEISLGKADIGLTRMKPLQTNIACEAVHEDAVILVAPFMERSKQSDIDEERVLQQYRLLTNNHPSYWESLLSEIKRYYPRIRTIPVTQVEITKRFIEQGLGVSYLPVSMVKDGLRNKTMMEVKPNKIIPPASFTYVVTKMETSEVKQFKAFLAAILRHE